ncbi:MAG: histidine kinase [Syntrophomonadaceae bacterium]
MTKDAKDLFENKVFQHFLFNSLNSVASLCRTDPEAAAELVIEISTFLQKSLEKKPPLITLAEELEQAASYVSIQKARFANRLEILFEIEEEVECLLPPFTLQPLIDNAVIHGVLKRRPGGIVLLSVQSTPQGVHFKITDNGVGMNSDQLALLLDSCNNVHSLFQIDYKLKANGFNGLTISSVKNRGTEVSFTISSHVYPA